MVSHVLHVHLLGHCQLTYGDQLRNAFASPRLRSLFAQLILNVDVPQARQQLAFRLYPDATEAQARNNLRQLVHLLRNALPDADLFLRADTHTLQWLPDSPFTLDVVDFRTALSCGALKQAVELYRGDLMPHCHEDWIIPVRERLRQRYIGVLKQLARDAEDSRSYDVAISYTRLLLQSDPLYEEMYGQLMRLQMLNGNRAAALHTYQECAALLRRVIGVELCSATRAIYEHALNITQKSEHRMYPPAQLAGRKKEWSRLQPLWHTAAAGSPHVALITGEAGFGKTRLLQELVAWVAHQAIQLVSAARYACGAKLLFAPVVEWLRATIHLSMQS